MAEQVPLEAKDENPILGFDDAGEESMHVHPKKKRLCRHPVRSRSEDIGQRIVVIAGCSDSRVKMSHIFQLFLNGFSGLQ